MSFAPPMSPQEKLTPAESPDQPFLVNGEPITPFDALEAALNANVDPDLIGVVQELGETDQIVAYYRLTAIQEGVSFEDIEKIPESFTPQQLVRRLIELAEFESGKNANKKFEDGHESLAPEFSEVYYDDSIDPASYMDPGLISRFRSDTRAELEARGIPEDTIDMVVTKASEIFTNVKQQYPTYGGHVWLGMTQENASKRAEILLVTEGNPEPQVSLLKGVVSVEQLKDQRDEAEHGRGDRVMKGQNGRSGKFTRARNAEGKPIAYQAWCTTPLPRDFNTTA